MTLLGAEMVRLVAAIPVVQELLGEPVIIGGVAVMSRLGAAHRATSDLDALRRRADGAATGLEVLAATGADVDAVGGELTTPRGPVRLDVLELGPHDLRRNFTDATDRLEAHAHEWALATATVMTLYATSADDHAQCPALVASPGALVAMKLKASVDRQDAKRATDLLDVVRLLTDPTTARDTLVDLAGIPEGLREDLLLHARHQFERDGVASRRLIQGLRAPGVDSARIDAAAAVLLGALDKGVGDDGTVLPG